MISTGADSRRSGVFGLKASAQTPIIPNIVEATRTYAGWPRAATTLVAPADSS